MTSQKPSRARLSRHYQVLHSESSRPTSPQSSIASIQDGEEGAIRLSESNQEFDVERGTGFAQAGESIPNRLTYLESLWRAMRGKIDSEGDVQLQVSANEVDSDNDSEVFNPESKRRLSLPSWRRRKVKYNPIQMFLGATVAVLSALGVLYIVNLIYDSANDLYSSEFRDPFLSHWGASSGPGAALAHYPTDFTRDVLPIPCHSHNDYWRKVPLYQAIHFGCTGVEADVWLFDNELYVGHDTHSLTRNRTLRSLYVNPLVEILDKMNQKDIFTDDETIIQMPSSPSEPKRGVFDEDHSQTLVLLIDFKNNGTAIWPYVSSQLEALREKNYLTYFNGTSVINGPITIVATGNAPFELVVANATRRDIFFDAPIDKFVDIDLHTIAEEGTTYKYNFTNSYYASASLNHAVGRIWQGKFSDKQYVKLRQQIKATRERGLKVRYWDTPGWPVGARNRVWRELVKEGVDYLNVDDLKAAGKHDWSGKRGHEGEW